MSEAHALRAVGTSRSNASRLAIGVFAIASLVAARADSTVLRWTQVASGPPAREFAAAAYGAGKILVFGGRTGGVAMNDTWLWNGTVWKQINAGNPPPRFGAAMAYDQNSGLFVLIGGTSGGGPLFGITFRFDPNTETWIAPGNPGPQRAFHALVWDAFAQRVMLFGGTDMGGALPSDLFSWDGTNWTNVATSGGGTLGRSRHALAFDPNQGLVLYGGLAGFPLDDAWVLSAGTWTLLSGTWTGAARNGHGMAFDPNQGKLVLYDGRSTGALDDVRLSNGNVTTRIFPVGTAPSARSGVAIVYDETRSRIVAIGGANNAGVALSDATWELFMTGQDCTSNGQCATKVCARAVPTDPTGVCCLTPCDPPCKECDRINTLLDPNTRDGECRLVTGNDPRFCMFDPGCRGTCSEGLCLYPGRTTPCGLCLACNDKTGKCDQMPMSQDDANCKPPNGMPTPSCPQADLSCRTYNPPSVLHRCLAPAKCGWRWSDCTNLKTNSFPCQDPILQQ